MIIWYRLAKVYLWNSANALFAMESIVKSINPKKILLIAISVSFLSSCYNLVVAEVLNKNNIDEIDFETALNQNSVQFHEYEKPESLFDNFFGFGDALNEYSFNTNFQDLSLQIDSKNIRDLYNEKLLKMTKKVKKNEDNKANWSFYNKRI